MKTIYNDKSNEVKVIALSDNSITQRVTVVHENQEDSEFYCEFLFTIGTLVYVLKNGFKWGDDINHMLSSESKYNIAESIIRHQIGIRVSDAKRYGDEFNKANEIENYSTMFAYYNGLNASELIRRFIK